MDDIILRMKNMPLGVNGTTVRDIDGNYNVYINEYLTYEEQLKAYAHEIEHIEQKHFDSHYGYWICEEKATYGAEPEK